jgi:transcriptional regulator with XRE-family HTH domain
MKDRIILLIKAKNLTAAQFADEIGVQKSSISHIISGRNNASLDFIQKVLLTYPEVNIEWLMFGKGPLFKTNETTLNNNNDGDLSSVRQLDLAHVDLFTELVPAKSSDFRKENDLNSGEKPAENVKHEVVENEARVNEPKNPEKASTEVELNKAENIMLSSGHREPSTKKIVKIVEFYSDNTYKEYFPE